jgi:hypothetical protein
VGSGERTRGSGEAAARHGRRRARLEGHLLGADAAVVGGGERARGSGEAAASHRRRRARLEGQIWADTTVAGGGERTQGGGEPATILWGIVTENRQNPKFKFFASRTQQRRPPQQD